MGPCINEGQRDTILNYVDIGNFTQAEGKLLALSTLLADRPELKQLQKKVQRLLETVQARIEDKNWSYALLETSLQRADEFMKAGQSEEAKKLCDAVIELYEDDPDAKSQVERAKALLGQSGQ